MSDIGIGITQPLTSRVKKRNITLKKPVIILPILILVSSFCYCVEYSRINSTQVRLRSKPDTKSKIVEVLRKGERIKVLKKLSAPKLIGSYFGRWYQVETRSKKSGYVLSAFIDENDGDEKFHIFYRRFYSSLKKNGWFAIQRMGLPFKYINVTFPDPRRKFSGRLVHTIKTKESLSILYTGDGSEMKPVFSFVQNKYIKVYIDFMGTGCSTEWFFRKKNKKWYLHQAIVYSY